jgi:hypothetical protein
LSLKRAVGMGDILWKANLEYGEVQCNIRQLSIDDQYIEPVPKTSIFNTFS